jgi:RNA polymerase sigma-70 factor (ECF subfamily)
MLAPRHPQRLDDELSDAIAIARVLAGHTDRFAELVQRYQAALHRHAVSIVLDHDVASDMVQDAFIRAFTQLRACRDRTRFRCWLFQVLRNRCLDYLKEAARRGVTLEDVHVDRVEDPGDALDRERFRSRLIQALAALPAVQREAFVMHYVDDVPYPQMAQLLGTSVSALKMRVLRAREALGARLQVDEVTGLDVRSSMDQTRIEEGT